MEIGMNNFVNSGADEALLKSLAGDERYQDNDELAKALKKEGLVQVQTTVNGKHDTYTRMQWKRASDVKAGDHVVGQQKPAGQDEAHKDEKPQVARLQDFKVDKTTTPATATFEFKGKKYTATEGKNLTLHVRTTFGENAKISGKLKLTDGGYPRIGSYPVEGLDNIISVSAKESGSEAPKAEPKAEPKTEGGKPTLEQKIRANPDGWRRHENGAMAWDGTLYPSEDSDLGALVEEVTGGDQFDFFNEAGPKLSNALDKDYAHLDDFDVDTMGITSAKVKDNKVEITAHVGLTVYMDDGSTDKDERDVTFTMPYKNKGTSPHD